MNISTINQTALILTSTAALARLFDAPPSQLLRGVQLGAFLSSAAAIYIGMNAHNQPANKREISSRNKPAFNFYQAAIDFVNSQNSPNLTACGKAAFRSFLTGQGPNKNALLLAVAVMLVATGVIKADAKMQNFARVVAGLTTAAAVIWHVKKNNPLSKKPVQPPLQLQFLKHLPLPTAYPANPASNPLPKTSDKDVPQDLALSYRAHLLTISDPIFALPNEFGSLQEYVEAGADIADHEGPLTTIQEWITKDNYKGPTTTRFLDSIDTLMSYLTQLKELRQKNFTNFLRKNYIPFDMGGEGDCFPRAALGCFMKRTDVDAEHSNLRNILVQIMENDRATYGPIIKSRVQGEEPWFKQAVQASSGKDEYEKYLNYMKQDGSYCGTPEARAASEYFKRPIAFLQHVSGDNYSANAVTPEAIQFREPMAILNLEESHFQSLRPRPRAST